jgi:hypothetical protein
VAILGAPQAEDSVSNSEFEQMKRDLGLDEETKPRGRASRLTEHTAHTDAEDDKQAAGGSAAPSASSSTLTPPPAVPPVEPTQPPLQQTPGTPVADGSGAQSGAADPVVPAPDEAENQSVPKPPSSRPPRSGRNRRHGRKR